MNNDENNRIKKYDFNEEEYGNKKSTSSNVSIWPIIIFIVVIAALIIGGVKAVTHFTSNNNSPKTELKSNKNNQISTDQDDNNKSYQEYNSKNSSETKSNKSNDSNENNANSKNNQKNNNDGDIFSQQHTFSSVVDAQNYAKATQSKWLNDGYNTYTVSSDSQGYYTLKFVK